MPKYTKLEVGEYYIKVKKSIFNVIDLHTIVEVVDLNKGVLVKVKALTGNAKGEIFSVYLTPGHNWLKVENFNMVEVIYG